MKKVVLFVALATVFGLSFVACSSKAENPEDSQNQSSNVDNNGADQSQSAAGENPDAANQQ